MADRAPRLRHRVGGGQWRSGDAGPGQRRPPQQQRQCALPAGAPTVAGRRRAMEGGEISSTSYTQF